MYQKPPRTLTETECEVLLKCLRREDSSGLEKKRGIRNYLAALFMLDAGLRIGEVVGLRISDLMIYDETVIRLLIRAEITKTKHERTVPLSIRLRRAILDAYRYFWFEPCRYAYRPAMPGTDAGVSITTVQLERIIKVTAAGCLHRRVTPHMLRHTFATRLMRQTSPRVVQELLGHRNLASTQIYLHPDQEDLDKAINAI